MLVSAIVLVIVFTIGFICGKYAGKRAGYQLGFAEAPLALRQKSWEVGACVLCQAKSHSTDNANKPALRQNDC